VVIKNITLNYIFFFLKKKKMLIELRYQCFIHACSGIYLGNIFLLFFPLFIRFLCLKRPDVHSSCLDERVFETSTWHYVWTSLKFHPDGKPCKVKLYSPLPRTSFSPLLLCFLSSCAFSLCFLCVFLSCTCRLWILSPPQVCIYTLLLIFFF
jgi:hypothetical protein